MRERADKNKTLTYSLLITGTVITFVALQWLVLVLMGRWEASAEGGAGAVVIRVLNGATLNQVADTLIAHNLAENRREVTAAARLLGAERSLKPGRYTLDENMSLYRTLVLLTRGETGKVVVTILEGWTSRQIADELVDKMLLNREKFLSLVEDSTLKNQLGIDAPSLEGFLFPETYHFDYGMDEEQVIRRMVAVFLERYGDAERAKARERGMTLNEVVTLASIIEGEAVFDSERREVSSVYHNRLKAGMRLQADPTVQYIIPDGPRRLYSDDLWIDSPYNTYRHAGLPPGAISNPGLASLRAAISPADTKYLYFVARGDGYHTFSKTLEEHNRAKRRFQRVRQEVERQQREAEK